MSRVRYTPRLTWRPIVRVRYKRVIGHEVHRSWRFYLFGLLPVVSVPR